MTNHNEQNYIPTVETLIKNNFKATAASYQANCPLQSPTIAIYPVRYAINENPFLESLAQQAELTPDDWHKLTHKKTNHSLTKQDTLFNNDLPTLQTREYTLRPLRKGWLYIWTLENDWTEYEITPPNKIGQLTTFKKTDINQPQDQRQATGAAEYALYFNANQHVYITYSPVQWTHRQFKAIKETDHKQTMRLIKLPEFIATMTAPHAEYINQIDKRVADIFSEQANTTFLSSTITNTTTEHQQGFKREQAISIPKAELIAHLNDPMNALFIALDDPLAIIDDLLLNAAYPISAMEAYEHSQQRKNNIAQILIPTCGAGIEEFIPDSILQQGAGKKYQYLKDVCNDLLEPASLLAIYQSGTYSTAQENLANAQQTLVETCKKEFLAKWQQLPKQQVTTTNIEGETVITTWQQHIEEWNNTRQLRRKLDFNSVFDHLTAREQTIALYQQYIAITITDLLVWLNKLPISLLGTALQHDMVNESQSLALYHYADKILTFIHYDKTGQDWLKAQLAKPSTLFGYSFFHFNQELQQFFSKIATILIQQSNIKAQGDNQDKTALDYANLGASRLTDYLGALTNPQLKASKYYNSLSKPAKRAYQAYCELIKTPLGDLYKTMQLKSLASLAALPPEAITAYASFTTLTSSDNYRIVSNFRFNKDFINWKDQLNSLITEDKKLAKQNRDLSQKAGERKKQRLAYPKVDYKHDRAIIKANSQRRKELKRKIYMTNHRQPIAIIADENSLPITMGREDYLFLQSGQQEAMQQGLLKIESRIKGIERSQQHIKQWQGKSLPMAMVLWNLANTINAIKEHKDNATITSNMFYTANAVGALWLAPIWAEFSQIELRYTASMLKHHKELLLTPTKLLATIATKDLYQYRQNLVKVGGKVGSSAAIIEMVIKRVAFVNGLMAVGAAFEIGAMQDDLFYSSNGLELVGQIAKVTSLSAMVTGGIISISMWLGSSIWGIAFAMGAFVTTALLVAGVVYLLATLWIELFHREGLALWIDNCVFGTAQKWITEDEQQNQLDELTALYKILLYPEVKIKQTRKLLTNFDNCVYQTTGYWLQFSFPVELDYCPIEITTLMTHSRLLDTQAYSQDLTQRIANNGFWSNPSISMDNLLPTNPVIGVDTIQPDYSYTGFDNRFIYNVWLPYDGLYNNSYLDLQISYPFDLSQKANLDSVATNEQSLNYSFLYQIELFNQKDIVSHEQPETPITSLEFLKDSKENKSYLKSGKFNHAIKRYNIVVGLPIGANIENDNDY
ncbi:toxin VasX [Entomomonas asaccharolytica]|uniref:Toxin VasX N-terminal region domain-containing protein n=1 Tax=Entomomonas asaccharolytica TaxID=2785331 RepID=A0A974RWQ9_9GAMM|nr:toxin VasX [Entomomonas asaccharolytica]QQP85461.1 hypothetical protein JHT90_13975 [Entomomonas asaccharolytica]